MQSTSDYSIFKKITGNREIVENQVMRLVKIIAANNMLAANPIIVNEDMEVIDGQHRLQAAMKLGVPVYYIVSNGANLKDVQRLNTSARRWSTMDFINSYIQLGKREYKELMKFLEDYEVNVEMALNFLGKQSGGEYIRLKEGSLTFSPEQWEIGRASATLYNALKPYLHAGYGRTAYLARAVLKITVLGKGDQLLEKLGQQDVEIFHSASVKDYLRQFEDVLNYKTKGNVRLF